MVHTHKYRRCWNWYHGWFMYCDCGSQYPTGYWYGGVWMEYP